jgi:hypothetical protein
LTSVSNKRPRPGQRVGALDDVLWLHRSSSPNIGQSVESLEQDNLDSKTFAELFKKNYVRLDPQNSGISKEQLSKFIMRPDNFTKDEYVMLMLVAKYFDTIANLDDAPDSRTKITALDAEVLGQFLIHGNLSMAELHRWRMLCSSPADDTEREPPPLASH